MNRFVSVTAKVSSLRVTETSAPSGKVAAGGSLIEGPGKPKVRSAETLWVDVRFGVAFAMPSAPSGIQPT